MVDRKVGGLALLLVAALLAMIVPRLLDPGLPGFAIRAPLPAPPPVGSCLTEPDLTVVDCSSPHDREVVRTWAADDVTKAVNVAPYQLSEDSCSWAAGTYLGRPWEPAAGWLSSVMNYSAELVLAPEDERVAGLVWKMCTIAPVTPVSYTGSVQGAAEHPTRPGAYGTCLDGTARVSCADPHDHEIFAYTTGFEPSAADADVGGLLPLPSAGQLKLDCDQMALAVMKRQVTDDDAVTVGVVTTRTDPGLYSSDSAGLPVFGTAIIAECSIQTSGGMALTDSVVGIGDGLLPLR